jgi:hypothetical protein
MIVCKTPSSRRGIWEIRLETADLNHDAASGRRNADNVCSTTGVAVLPSFLVFEVTEQLYQAYVLVYYLSKSALIPGALFLRKTLRIEC